MRIGVPKESKPGERRVAATPKTVEQIIKLGYDVSIESGAGVGASFDDAAYRGGRRRHRRRRGLGRRHHPEDQRRRRRRGRAAAARARRWSACWPRRWTPTWSARCPRAASPPWPWTPCRASRARSRWTCCRRWPTSAATARSSRPRNEFGSFFTGQVTAAGKVPPAKVLVVGAGVAGLAAIGTANSLGAIVRAFDARPEVGEQVESMGAEFLRIDVEDTGPSATGYAKEMGEDFNRKAAELYAEQAKDVDIVITTALIPGQAGPAAAHRGDGRLDEARQRRRRHGRGQRRQRRRQPARRAGRHRQRRDRSSATPTCRAGCPPRPRSCSAPTWSTCSS